MGTVALLANTYSAQLGVRSIVGSCCALLVVFIVYSFLPRTKHTATIAYALVCGIVFFGTLTLLSILASVHSGSAL